MNFTDVPFGFDIKNNCFMQALQKKYDVEISETPDFIFYSAFGTEFLKHTKCVRIFLALEPVLPNFNDCDYSLGPFPLSFGDRYFRLPPFANYGEDDFWKILTEEREVPKEAFDRKFCNFVYSNANSGEGALKRIEFCRKLAEYKHIDCPGKVLNNMPAAIEPRYGKGDFSEDQWNPQWIQSKMDFLRCYKFTIAFENCAMPGWTTEKLIHPMLAGSVPIYWGAPDVTEYFNPKSFINCADYGYDFQAVIQRIMELDEDEEQYLSILRQRPLLNTYPFDWKNDLAEYLAKIVERGAVPLEKNPIGFPTMTVQNYQGLCRAGKIGMRKIVWDTMDSIKGWLFYKFKKERDRL